MSSIGEEGQMLSAVRDNRPSGAVEGLRVSTDQNASQNTDILRFTAPFLDPLPSPRLPPSPTVRETLRARRLRRRQRNLASTAAATPSTLVRPDGRRVLGSRLERINVTTPPRSPASTTNSSPASLDQENLPPTPVTPTIAVPAVGAPTPLGTPNTTPGAQVSTPIGIINCQTRITRQAGTRWQPNGATQLPSPANTPRQGPSTNSIRDLPRPVDTVLYELLEVGWRASPTRIRAAYRNVCLRNHPDRVRAEYRELATALMAYINAARSTLLNYDARKRYHETGHLPWAPETADTRVP